MSEPTWMNTLRELLRYSRCRISYSSHIKLNKHDTAPTPMNSKHVNALSWTQMMPRSGVNESFKTALGKTQHYTYSICRLVLFFLLVFKSFFSVCFICWCFFIRWVCLAYTVFIYDVSHDSRLTLHYDVQHCTSSTSSSLQPTAFTTRPTRSFI